jgi:hypothetical protein
MDLLEQHTEKQMHQTIDEMIVSKQKMINKINDRGIRYKLWSNNDVKLKSSLFPYENMNGIKELKEQLKKIKIAKSNNKFPFIQDVYMMTLKDFKNKYQSKDYGLTPKKIIELRNDPKWAEVWEKEFKEK